MHYALTRLHTCMDTPRGARTGNSAGSIRGANIFELGSVKNALIRLQEIKEDCIDCVNPPNIDTNALMSLDLSTILNYAKVYRRYR